MTKFIAEIGSNANKDFGRAYEMIERAKEAGFWAVKFQYFDPETLYAPGHGSPETLREQAWENAGQVLRLAAYAKDAGIRFGCTVFRRQDLPAFLTDSAFLKVSSFENQREDFLRCAAHLAESVQIPLMVSLGGLAADLNIWEFDLRRIIHWIGRYNVRLVLLHCVSAYPQTPESTQLRRAFHAMKEFRRILNESQAMIVGNNAFVELGYSDHSALPGVVHRAIGCRAEYVELHVDLEDRAGRETKHGHCWTFPDAARLIRDAWDGDRAFCAPFDNWEELRELKSDPDDEMRPLKEYRNDL